MTEFDRKMVGENDLRKLHLEVNQIVQQRFYLTTIAVLIFGTVCGWAASSVSKDKPIDPNFAMMVEFLLISILSGLYAYFMLLLGMMRILTVYIKEKYDSPWETEWEEYRSQKGSRQYKGYSKAGTLVFSMLGIMSLCFFTVLIDFGRGESICWLWGHTWPIIVVVILYEASLLCFTRWRKNVFREDKILQHWKRALDKVEAAKEA